MLEDDVDRAGEIVGDAVALDGRRLLIGEGPLRVGAATCTGVQFTSPGLNFSSVGAVIAEATGEIPAA